MSADAKILLIFFTLQAIAVEDESALLQFMRLGKVNVSDPWHFGTLPGMRGRMVTFSGVCKPILLNGFHDDRIPDMTGMKVCIGRASNMNQCDEPDPRLTHTACLEVKVLDPFNNGKAYCGAQIIDNEMPDPRFILTWESVLEGDRAKKKVCIESPMYSGMGKRCSYCRCKGCRGHCDPNKDYSILSYLPARTNDDPNGLDPARSDRQTLADDPELSRNEKREIGVSHAGKQAGIHDGQKLRNLFQPDNDDKSNLLSLENSQALGEEIKKGLMDLFPKPKHDAERALGEQIKKGLMGLYPQVTQKEKM